MQVLLLRELRSARLLFRGVFSLCALKSMECFHGIAKTFTIHFFSTSLMETGLGIMMRSPALGIGGNLVKPGFIFCFRGVLDWMVLPTFSTRPLEQL